jgi:hypothetical protein
MAPPVREFGVAREARVRHQFARRTTGLPYLAALERYLMWTPEIERLMTRRWISEVPSKIV